MKKIFAMIIICITVVASMALVGCDSGKKVDMDISRFVLTFEDNFDGDTLDRSKWNYDFTIDYVRVYQFK